MLHPPSLLKRIEAWRLNSGGKATLADSTDDTTLLRPSLMAGQNWLKLKQQGVANIAALKVLQKDVKFGASDRAQRPPMTRKEMMRLSLSAPTWWRMPDTSSRAADRFDKKHTARSAVADRLCNVSAATQRVDVGMKFEEALFAVRVNRYYEPKRLEKAVVYHGKPRKVNKKPFDLYKSIWAPRCKSSDSHDVYDTDEVEFRRFSIEWQMLIDLDVTKNVLQWDDDEDGAWADEDGDGIPDEVEDVGMVFWNTHDLLHALFTYYSALSGSFLSMSMNAWTACLNDFKLVSKKSKFCKQRDADIIFVEVNAKSKRADPSLSAAGDNERTLSRLEFYSALLKLAIRKYVMTGEVTDVSEALERLIMYDIHRKAISSGTSARIFIDANDFRRRHSYEEAVCNVLLKNEASLRNLFRAIRSMNDSPSAVHGTGVADARDLMSLEEWLLFLRGADLVDRDLSERDATLCFAWSRMIVVDPRHGKGLQRDSALPFEGFMEALCRAATLKALPTQEDLKEMGAKDAGHWIDKMKAMSHYEKILDERATPFGQDAPRPLDESLQMVIDILRRAIEKITQSGKNDGVISEAEAKQFATECGKKENEAMSKK